MSERSEYFRALFIFPSDAELRSTLSVHSPSSLGCFYCDEKVCGGYGGFGDRKAVLSSERCDCFPVLCWVIGNYSFFLVALTGAVSFSSLFLVKLAIFMSAE